MHIVSVLIKKNCSFSIIFSRRLKGISIRIVNCSDIVWGLSYSLEDTGPNARLQLWRLLICDHLDNLLSDRIRLSEEWGHWSLPSWLRLWRSMSYHPGPDHHHHDIIILMFMVAPTKPPGTGLGLLLPCDKQGADLPGLDNKICNFTFTNTEGDYNQDKTPVIIWPCIYSHIIW